MFQVLWEMLAQTCLSACVDPFSDVGKRRVLFETKRFPFFSILFPQFLKRMTDHYLKTFFLLSLKRIHLKKPPSFSDSEADLFCCYFSF